jgi:hypothetical protein
MTSNFEQQAPSTTDGFCHAAPRPQHGRQADREAQPAREAARTGRTAQHAPGGAPGWAPRTETGPAERTSAT